MDYLGKYEIGSHCWYLQSRAKEGACIPGRPMNKAAKDSNRPWDDGNGNSGGGVTHIPRSHIPGSPSSALRFIRRFQSRDLREHEVPDEELYFSPKVLRKTRKKLQLYLPIEKLASVLERVPPPLGMMTRKVTKASADMRIARIITSLHTNIHETPVSKTSVEVCERFCVICHCCTCFY